MVSTSEPPSTVAIVAMLATAGLLLRCALPNGHLECRRNATRWHEKLNADTPKGNFVEPKFARTIKNDHLFRLSLGNQSSHCMLRSLSDHEKLPDNCLKSPAYCALYVNIGRQFLVHKPQVPALNRAAYSTWR